MFNKVVHLNLIKEIKLMQHKLYLYSEDEENIFYIVFLRKNKRKIFFIVNFLLNFIN